jgi:exosortase/archaeosortase family protein
MNDVNGRKNHSTDRSSLVWIVFFLVLMGFFYYLDQTPWFQEVVLARLARWTAGGTVFILCFLGLQLNLAGSTIIGPAMRVEIAASCSGSLVFLMFAAAVIPFPAPWKTRLKGLMMGLLTLLIINLLRTSLIVLVVSRFPGSLWTFHIVIGQVMVIAAMMGVFLWWAKNTHGETSFAFFKNNRAILRVLLLFSIGYGAAYSLYQVFLASPLGLFVSRLIEIHMKWVLSFFNTHFFSGHLPSFSPVSVKLVAGCLSSPIVVLLAAVVFAWPAKWWKRFLVIFLGFIPFFYGYHLLRAVLVSLTLGLQTKNVNLVYNFYGQVFLMLFLFGVLAYFKCSRQNVMSYKKYLTQLALSCLVALPAAAFLAWLANHWLTPLLLRDISGSTVPSFDPEQVVSTMLPVWAFIWLVLVGTTPDLALPRKSLMGLMGVLVALLLYALALILFETFHLAPHKGLLKLFVILLPFAGYRFCQLFPLKERTDPKNVEPSA